tara:strand:- start:22967 stop:23584 length:618 start_codon:yes stop_codon:yes gene_type:complete
MSDTPPNIIVSGFGRCGTTAMMHMLWHGQCEMASEPPDYEDKRTLSGPTFDNAWLCAQRGKAVKLLYVKPPRMTLDVPAKIIWLDRDPKDQARSQIKLLRVVSDPQAFQPTLADVGKLARSIRASTPAAIGTMRRHGEVMRVRFRDLLGDPEATAQRVQDFLGRDAFPLAKDGAGAILPRPHRCADDLAVEHALSRAFADMGTGA